ncbi:lantibiotic dehydratase [Streptomyces sp. NPDC088253]|uniref:lantibiotic dehydratase n=1 Tax=Streptomyces sp. NPDC088253 TaxID=3365846 RepID=UPI0038043CFE
MAMDTPSTPANAAVSGPRIPDFGTIPPAPAGRGTVAPVLMARVCGLPVGVLDESATPRSTGLLRDALDAADAAGELAGSLADAIYRLVPRLDGDRAARRAAVGLRRDIHNGRLAPSTGRAADLVSARLDPGPARRLKAWLEAMRRYQDGLGQAEEVFATELPKAGEALFGRLREPRVASGLALASPQFARRLLAQDGPAPAGLDTRGARSAAAYLSRIAVKPSPFSTLTTLDVAWLGSAPPEVARPAPRQSGQDGAAGAVTSSRGLAVALLLACAAHPDLAPALDVVANSGLRRVGDRLLAALPVYAAADGFFFREDEVTDCGLYEWAPALLPSRPTPFTALAARLGTNGPQLAARWVEMGLLQPVTPWRLADGRHLRALSRAVRHRTDADASPAAAGVRAALDTLGELEATVTTTVDAAERAQAVEATRDAARATFKELGRPVPSWLDGTPLFHEAVASPEGPAHELPGRVGDDLAHAARWLAPHVTRTPLYDGLVERFVHRYGVGGTCSDLLGFLYEVLAHADPYALARQDTLPPAGDPRGDDIPAPGRLLGHGTLGTASNSLFFQVAAEDAAHVAAGDYTLVVNLVQNGVGGLLSRWACVPSLHDRIAPALDDWLRGLHPGCRVLQVSAYPDWSEMQRPTLSTVPRLRWPTDLPDGDPTTVDMAGLSLCHDPDTGTLQAYDHDGSPVAFAYLGTTPTYLLRGAVRLLCLLSDPWMTLGRADREVRAFDRVTTGEGAQYLPRTQHGRVVWARARWRLPAARLPRPDPGVSPVRFLADVERWRRQHGLPEEVFLVQITRGPRGVRKEKPQWLGFDNPYVVWAALRQIRSDALAVDLVEALPGRGEHWNRDAAGAPVATEFSGLVRHG